MVSYPGSWCCSPSKWVLILIVMDNGLLPPAGDLKLLSVEVLILIVMDNGLLRLFRLLIAHKWGQVLILIVMDNGLLLFSTPQWS